MYLRTLILMPVVAEVVSVNTPTLTLSSTTITQGVPLTLTCTTSTTGVTSYFFSIIYWTGSSTVYTVTTGNTLTLTYSGDWKSKSYPEIGSTDRYSCRAWVDSDVSSESARVGPVTVAAAPDSGSQTVCEGGNYLSIACPDRVILITSAAYGRWDRDTCTTYANGNPRPTYQLLKTNCASNKAGQIIETACNGNMACEVKVTNTQLGGDPCGNTYKYAVVDWECVSADDIVSA